MERDDAREEECPPAPVPSEFATAVAGYRWARDLVGEAGAAVYRLHSHRTAPDLFLKVGQGAVAGDVTDEMVRLRWLAGHLPVPRLIRFLADADAAWLLTEALPGVTAYQVLEAANGAGAVAGVVDALADWLMRLHAIPAETCPFNADHRLRLRLARRRVEAGLVDEDEFDPERAGWSAARLWDEMQALLPLGGEAVVTHGDYSLDNILLRDGRVTGCIDLGRLGVADRYQDLAILWNCLGEFGEQAQARMFRRCGIASPDPRRLEFHLMLDEMF